MQEHEIYSMMYKHAESLKSNYERFQDLDVEEWTKAGLAICKIESNYDVNASNPNSSAKGLMQVLSGTQDFVESNLLGISEASSSKMFDADYNLMIGMAYLGYQLNRYKNVEKSIIAYNQGSYNTSTAGSIYYKKWLGAYYTRNYEVIAQLANTLTPVNAGIGKIMIGIIGIAGIYSLWKMTQ